MPSGALGKLQQQGGGSALPCPALLLPSGPGKRDALRLSCSAACQDGLEQTLLQGGKLLSGRWRKLEGRKLSG